MTARTLEEIEALAAEATPGPYSLNECGQGAELMMLGGPSRKYVATVRIHQVPRHMGEWEEKKRAKTAELLAALPDILAIAQEQRGAMNADEARTREAAMRVWGEHVRGCDTADAMADLIVSQRAELDAVFAAIDEVDAACEDQAFGWSLRKDTARKRLQALRDKRKTGTKR